MFTGSPVSEVVLRLISPTHGCINYHVQSGPDDDHSKLTYTKCIVDAC